MKLEVEAAVRCSLVLLVLVLALAGCASKTTATPTATPAVARTYNDASFNFSFKYPSDWKAPKKGEIQPGNLNYIVHLKPRDQASNLEVEVSGQVSALPPVTNGEIVKDPSGPDKFQYFNTTVSGRHGLRVLRLSSGVPDEIATFVNVGHRQFVVRMITGVPPFTASDTHGYYTIVGSLRLPFSA